MFKKLTVLALVAFASAPVNASIGLTEVVAERDGPVTVFYPSTSDAQSVKRGRFTFDFAVDGAVVSGNGRLIVISHGSGGAPWVHVNLARTLIEAGFIVAVAEHKDDNYKHDGEPGPESWKRRPGEVSRAIDAIGRDPRFASRLKLDRVGAYGVSAGGHTMLSLAGGSWSPANFRKHCEAHIAEDFQACVGLITHLTGGVMDGSKKALALAVIRHRFKDAKPYTHSDPRIVAAVAGVPFAADFDLSSLETPRIPLALITARQDRWLAPRFHSDAVLAACSSCERLGDFEAGGHGALLSPLPPNFTGLIGDLINDPKGFDRSETSSVDRKVVAFFVKHVLAESHE